MWSIAIITILGELGINLGPLIAGAGIAGIALGFGAQSLVKDFLAGIFIIVEDQYGVGDIIDVGELSNTPVSGTVESVSLRSTKLRSVNGTVWHVPNGTVLRVGNMSQQWARALLDVSVAYGSDLDLAQAEIKRVADELWHDPAWAGQVLEEPEVWGVEDLAPDGVTIRLVVKTQPAEQFKVLRELRIADQGGPRRGRRRDPHRPAHGVGAARRRQPGRRRRPRRAGRRRAPERPTPPARASTVDGEGVADLGGQLGDDAGLLDVVGHELRAPRGARRCR